MANNWYENETLGPVGGGDPGQALVRNNLTEPVTNIAYIQGGWVTVFEDADMLDLPINKVFHGQIVYVSASHKLYAAKRFPPSGGPPSHSFYPIDLPHEAFNASSGSLPASLGHLSSSNVFSSSGQFTGTNLTFTGEVTMSNNLEVEGNLDTDTLSFNGVNFTAVTTDFSDGSTVFGANASGALDPSSPQSEDLEPSDLNHKFTGSLLITGGLIINNIDYKTFATSTTVTASINAAIATLQADVDQNESDADDAIAALQADVDQNESDADAAIAAVQADVDQNESDADAAIAALQADVDQNESDADAAIAALQADVDQNELDADAAIAALQADVDQNESDADAAIAALQADVDQNESDADAAIAALQADVDQNELDADAAIVAISVINNAMASSSVVTESINTAVNAVSVTNPSMVSSSDLNSYVTFTEASHSQVHPSSDYISSSLSQDAELNNLTLAGDLIVQGDQIVQGSQLSQADFVLANQTSVLPSSSITFDEEIENDEGVFEVFTGSIGSITKPITHIHAGDINANKISVDHTDFASGSDVNDLLTGTSNHFQLLNNLSTDITTDASSTTKYPSVKTIKDYVDASETTINASIAAVQADVNQNESDADDAIAALQADVDQNELDADTAIAAIQANETNTSATIAALNAATGSFMSETGSINGDLVFSGKVTMSNNLEVTGHLETDTISFDGINFTTATINDSDGNTTFGANASGALDPSNPQPEDLEPSDLNHKFTGSLLITGGLIINNIDYKTFATSTTVTASINAAIATLQADVDQNESDADDAIAALQADVNQNESDADNAIAAISVANNFMASSSVVTESINTALTSYVTLTEASHSQVVPNPNYVSSSDVITTSTTGITELSYDSLVVSDIDIPLTNENASPTITNGVVVGGNTTNGQYNFNVQTNLTEAWPDVSTHIEGGISTIVNTVDNSDETTTRYHHQSEDFNFVFNFGTPRIVSEFRIRFQKEGELGSSVFEIPENIFIYGKNELFADGEDDGVFLGEGADPGNTNTIIFSSTPSSNPVSLYGIGTELNLSRTSSIAETSLTSSFQYYRVRFQKDTRNPFNQSNFTKIANITPVIRNFEESGTSISASNGVLNVNTIVTNNLIGTASFADFATTANSAISSSYAITASFVEGATNVTLTSVNSDITPDETDIRSLGTPNLKWKDIYAINTFFGGVHEINLKTEGLDQMQEGTVLTLQNGTLHPCKKEADPLVMGIVSKGENYPIILGAEPILVTGKVEEGDYIITSNIEGHGKGINPQHIYDKQLFGKIIAQAIEKGEGKSYTIKAMIRKM